MVFYTGDRFPEWKDSLFVGAMVGEQIQRVVFNMRGLPIRRDPLMWELRQRIRDVQQGPDGLLYALTEEDDGALMFWHRGPRMPRRPARLRAISTSRP